MKRNKTGVFLMWTVGEAVLVFGLILLLWGWQAVYWVLLPSIVCQVCMILFLFSHKIQAKSELRQQLWVYGSFSAWILFFAAGLILYNYRSDVSYFWYWVTSYLSS